MFKFLKKSKPITIFAPTQGTLQEISTLDDGVFSTKMLGDGFYIKPESPHIYSPVEGEVIMVFPTKHAIGLKTKTDDEVLLHMGVNTVELGGEPFTLHVEVGDAVTDTSLVATIDYSKLVSDDVSNEIIVVFPNSNKKIELINENQNVETSESVAKLI